MVKLKLDQDITLAAQPGSQRIRAFDVIRGYFLVVILIDHIELYPNGWDLFTGRGRLLVSAAEGFFFMSGLLVGLVYRRRIAQGIKFIFAKMWRRAAELYIASVFFTLLYTAAAVFLNHPSIKDGLYTISNWPHIIKETLLMRYGYGWADFLDRFAILMFMAPFGFYMLIKRKWWLLLGASLIAWALRGNSFTLSWQIIFTLGMLVGYHWHELTARWQAVSRPLRSRIKRVVVVAALVTFLVSYASVYILSLLNEKWSQLPGWGQSFTGHWNSANAWVWQYSQKWTMGPLRIVLFMLWFGALFMVVRRYEKQIAKYSHGLIELLGRNSLFVYIAHSMIVFIFKLLLPTNTNFVENFLITGAALFCLVAVTIAYKKLQPSINLRPRRPDSLRTLIGSVKV